MKIFFATIFFLIGISFAAAEEYNAKVIVVIDGDTLVVLHNNAKVKIRLANIDAPEKNQPFGMDSRQAMVGLVFKKQVHIDSKVVDKYGRTVAIVTVEGLNVNEQMVRRGMAWEYSYYKPGRGYMALQSEAQGARRGLWSQHEPIAPWIWRRTHPSVKAIYPKMEKNARTPHHKKTVIFDDTSCGHKKHCSQMNSCEEANYYFTQCGVKSLARGNDDVPCKKLCGTEKPE